MLRVGLTGGIGSGKSEVTKRLAERGAEIIDADLLAREAVAPGTPGLQAIIDAFGRGLLGSDGSLDRVRLGQLVFADEAARARLNAIVHPLVRAETARRFETAPPDAIVVNDVPLLVETGLAEAYDVVVVVATTPETQLQRLVSQRGMARADAEARIAAQAPLEAKVAAAGYVVDNNGSIGELDGRMDELWTALCRRRDQSPG